jgi:hypothetical protein
MKYRYLNLLWILYRLDNPRTRNGLNLVVGLLHMDSKFHRHLILYYHRSRYRYLNLLWNLYRMDNPRMRIGMNLAVGLLHIQNSPSHRHLLLDAKDTLYS